MVALSGIPKAALISINDMLDCCAKVQSGHEVLILAQIDGLYGGDNLVDNEAITWIQSVVRAKEANSSILWIDEVPIPHAWRFPPVVKAAMAGCDILINHSFNLVTEEISEFRNYHTEMKIRVVRNFATTASLLCTNWAQTPYELVSEIRYQTSIPFKNGIPWQIKDDNGTYLEGIILNPVKKAGIPGSPESIYSTRRQDSGFYFPWPEWMFPMVSLAHTSGVFIFDRMLSWWSRYIGISPYFSQPIRLTIDNNRIIKIDGGAEADALQHFLKIMKERVGDGVYTFDTLHFGVHPQAFTNNHQCPNVLHRRLIEHSHCSNIHFHIGAPPSIPEYPYWMHCTGDIRTATFKVGQTIVHDLGYLTTLDNPIVKAIAAKYPDRPGLESTPKHP